MTSPELPPEFTDQDVAVSWGIAETIELTGRIIAAVLPYYILFRVGGRVHLIPWGAVADIWVPEKKVEVKKE